jgi:biotin carboxyl carrier protein
LIYEVEINGRQRRVEILKQGDAYTVTMDGRRQRADVSVVNGVWSLILSDASADAGAASRRSYEVAVVDRAGGELTVHVNGRLVTAAVASARPAFARRGQQAGAGATGPQRVLAPMPGKVLRILVKPGDSVAVRQALVVVEAMKMENELRAARPGTVRDVLVKEGASVEAGAVLVVVE